MELCWTIFLVALALNGEVLTHLLKELLGSEAIEVLNHTVVVHHLEVILGEANCQQVVILFLAGVIGVGLRLLLTNVSSCSSAVMTVGNIEVRNLSELLGDALDKSIVGDAPECVTDAVLAHEVILGSGLSHLSDNLLQRLVGWEREEHRLHIGVVDANVLHAVFFLLATSELMLLDATFDIVHVVGCNHDTILSTAVHRLSIDVVHLLGVLNKPSVGLELLEVLHSLVIDLRIMLGGAVVEVDFRLDDVIERHFVIARLCPSLLA